VLKNDKVLVDKSNLTKLESVYFRVITKRKKWIVFYFEPGLNNNYLQFGSITKKLGARTDR
jgi:hypothetical protein